MKRKTKAKASKVKKAKAAKSAKPKPKPKPKAKPPSDPQRRDIELDPKQLYAIADITNDLIESAKRQPKTSRKIAIMYPCPGCGPGSGKSVGIPLWVDSPLMMSVTCLAGHDYMLRVLPPLVTETTWAPRVEFLVVDAALTEGEAMAEMALLEAEEQARVRAPLRFPGK